MGGHEQEPMHKFYDPRMFDILEEPAMRSRFDRTSDIAELPVELKTAEDFSIAGFRVKVAEPERADAHESRVWVEQKTFCAWLQVGNLQVSEAVASWWTELYPTETSGIFLFGFPLKNHRGTVGSYGICNYLAWEPQTESKHVKIASKVLEFPGDCQGSLGAQFVDGNKRETAIRRL